METLLSQINRDIKKFYQNPWNEEEEVKSLLSHEEDDVIDRILALSKDTWNQSEKIVEELGKDTECLNWISDKAWIASNNMKMVDQLTNRIHFNQKIDKMYLFVWIILLSMINGSIFWCKFLR